MADLVPPTDEEIEQAAIEREKARSEEEKRLHAKYLADKVKRVDDIIRELNRKLLSGESLFAVRRMGQRASGSWSYFGPLSPEEIQRLKDLYAPRWDVKYRVLQYGEYGVDTEFEVHLQRVSK